MRYKNYILSKGDKVKLKPYGDDWLPSMTKNYGGKVVTIKDFIYNIGFVCEPLGDDVAAYMFDVDDIDDVVYCKNGQEGRSRNKTGDRRMTIDELLVDFDEMGFVPTTLCENPDEYACKWKRRLFTEIEQLTRELAKEQEACVECELEQSWELFWRDKEIDRLRAESKRFENNMKSVLEIEKKNAVKEFAKKLKVRITKFIGRHDLSVRFFNDIVSDLLKEYEE